LVTVPFTIAYHPPDLGALLPCCTFTKHYHRGLGLHIDVSVVASIQHQVAGWKWWHRVIAVDNSGAQWRTLKESQNGGGRHRKEKKFWIRPVG
jgi:hypothetical protein